MPQLRVLLMQLDGDWGQAAIAPFESVTEALWRTAHDVHFEHVSVAALLPPVDDLPWLAALSSGLTGLSLMAVPPRDSWEGVREFDLSAYLLAATQLRGLRELDIGTRCILRDPVAVLTRGHRPVCRGAAQP